MSNFKCNGVLLTGQFTDKVDPETGTVERRIRRAISSAEYREQAADLEVTVAILIFAQDFIEKHGFREEYEDLKAKQNFDQYANINTNEEELEEEVEEGVEGEVEEEVQEEVAS